MSETRNQPYTDDDFVLALRAFALFTVDEKRQALHEFARLRFPSIEARLSEAVYQTIQSMVRVHP